LLVIADQHFEFVPAVAANIFKNRHDDQSPKKVKPRAALALLECGDLSPLSTGAGAFRRPKSGDKSPHSKCLTYPFYRAPEG
jgi:hypothetical protein